MNKRSRHDFDEDINEDMDELAYKYRFRNPNDRKRNRLGKNEHTSKAKRHRPNYDEKDYDE